MDYQVKIKVFLNAIVNSGRNAVESALNHIRTSAGDAEDSLKKTAQAAGGIAGKSSGIGRAASVLGTVGIAAVAARGAINLLASGVRALANIMRDFSQQETIDAKQAAVLRATGQAAGFTARELGKMSAEMSRLTGIADETISSAQTVMLTFRNIRGDVFKQAMQSALDMAQLFGSVESSVLQLGKALQDPIGGIQALTRVGVSFSAAQKEQIKNFIELGQLGEAQKTILDEIQKQVGGTAAAMGSTFAGAVNRLGNAWGDLRQQIGKTIAALHLVQPAMDWLEKKIRSIENSFAGMGSAADDAISKLTRPATDAKNAADQIAEQASAIAEGIAAKTKDELGKVHAGIDVEADLKIARLNVERIAGTITDEAFARQSAKIKSAAEAGKYRASIEAVKKEPESYAKSRADLVEQQENARKYAESLKPREAENRWIDEYKGELAKAAKLTQEINVLQAELKTLDKSSGVNLQKATSIKQAIEQKAYERHVAEAWLGDAGVQSIVGPATKKQAAWQRSEAAVRAISDTLGAFDAIVRERATIAGERMDMLARQHEIAMLNIAATLPMKKPEPAETPEESRARQAESRYAYDQQTNRKKLERLEEHIAKGDSKREAGLLSPEQREQLVTYKRERDRVQKAIDATIKPEIFRQSTRRFGVSANEYFDWMRMSRTQRAASVKDPQEMVAENTGKTAEYLKEIKDKLNPVR